MTGWDFASAWDHVAELHPERVALACSGGRTTWASLAERAARLAWHLRTEAQLEPGDRVAIALGNQAEYLETLYAALKLGCVPLNVDARHGPNQIQEVLDHSEAKAVVSAPARAKAVKTAVKRIGKPWRPALLVAGEQYEAAVEGAPPSSEWMPRHATGDDILLVYTGGTTGTTTAVVWRSEDLFAALRASSPHTMGSPHATVLPVAPLTHTLGLFPSLATLIAGGTVALVDTDPFDPCVEWDAVEREAVTVLSPGGEAFTRRLLDALDEWPGRWDLTRLRTIASSDAPLSDAIRQRIARQLPAAELVLAAAVDGTGARRFRVVDEATGREVEPGSGAVGLLAVDGPVPLGFYKDPTKTAAQFRTIDGVRYSVSGERATVGADGVVRRVHAGSTVHAGDAPVSAPHVETVLRKHPSVVECAVVGVPDRRSVERVVALVQVVDGHHLDEAELVAWSRSQLAASETPSRFLFVDALDPLVPDPTRRAAARRVALERLADEAG